MTTALLFGERPCWRPFILKTNRTSPPRGECAERALHVLIHQLNAKQDEMRVRLAEDGIADGGILVMPDLGGDLVPVPREKLLDWIRMNPEIWSREAIGLVQTPPPGALLVVYYGVELGHGVLVVGGWLSQGGAA